jgi:hypothetical protein
MSEDPLLKLDLSPVNALRIIREVAEDSARVVFLSHPRKQMRQRKIMPTQVLKCLKRGAIIEGPARDIKGNWRCTLNWRHAGDEVSVVVAIKHDHNMRRKLLVITAFS